jgi:hypothetical protein
MVQMRFRLESRADVPAAQVAATGSYLRLRSSRATARQYRRC